MAGMHLHVRFTDTDDGWVTAQVLEVPGAISQGRSRDEARANVLDALRELTTANDSDADVETLAVVAA